MKVIYEFDEVDPDIRDERKLFELSSKMYNSLFDIDNYLREVRKGRKEDDVEKIIDNIQDIVNESQIHEIP